MFKVFFCRLLLHQNLNNVFSAELWKHRMEIVKKSPFEYISPRLEVTQKIINFEFFPKKQLKSIQKRTEVLKTLKRQN
jgi:hypothetical protein